VLAENNYLRQAVKHMPRTGAIGALLDIYEKAISELKVLISDISDPALTLITDPSTEDENCRSIQTILTHVVSAGYGYATLIHNLKGHNVRRPDKFFHSAVSDYIRDLDRMFGFTETVFKEFKDNELEGYDENLKMKSSWGQVYDIEQLTEHAIVHILRHKRQIATMKHRLPK
jgi:uncharacterized damage-inducible protein DinB